MKTLVAGMGLSGMATARFLLDRGLSFETFDERKDADAVAQELDGVVHHQSAPHPSGYDQIVLSPGIAMTHPLVMEAKTVDTPLLSEVEFASRHAKGPIIAITGSNGKSTTTSLIHHLLDHSGLPAVMCGNIGQPFIGQVSDDPDRIYVLEVSSFQMEHVRDFHPHVGVMLNLAADHLDRHGDLETYKQCKFRIFANQTENDLAILAPEFVGQIPGNARQIALPGQECFVRDGFVQLDDSFRIPLHDLPLIGTHNHSNALFACAVARHMGLTPDQIVSAFPTFQGLEHRMERVGEYQGRLWINDTKATNVHAAQAALQSLDCPYVLILGGCDKGERFNGLNFDGHPPRGIIAYGDTAPLILEDLAHWQPIHIPQFEDACIEAHKRAQEGDAVLLAPACASFDQFPNFMARGHAFKQLFGRLSG